MDYKNQGSLFGELYPEFRLKRPIRLVEFFAGYGSQSLAMKYLGLNYESWKICEWNWKSFEAYKYLHTEDNTDYSKNLSKADIINILSGKGISTNWNNPCTYEQVSRMNEKQLREIYNAMVATHNLVDISRIHAQDLDMESEDNRKHDYVFTYSFPCFTADQLVLTEEKGYIPFIDLKIGMHVLAKDNEWHRIDRFFNQGMHDTIYVKAFGFEKIHCTINHKFWTRKKAKDGKLGNPEWEEAQCLQKGDYLGVPVIKEEKPYFSDSEDFWYVMGSYIGDGWYNSSAKDIRILCSKKKLENLEPKFKTLGIKYTIIQNDENCWNIRTSDKDFADFILNNFGTGSLDKHIPYEVMALPKKQLMAFFNGCLASDGSTIRKNIQFTTVNKNVAYSFLLIIGKLFNRPCQIHYVKVSETKEIQGRTINQHDWYQLRFKKENSKGDDAFYENGYIWYPFRGITQGEPENTYDIEVNEDHSFVLQNCIVSNCQDLSLAGKRKLGHKGSGTRSGLLWEFERIMKELTEAKQRPEVLLMENVPMVHGSGMIEDFNDWIDSLENMGYKSYFQDLIADDYGIPQIRNRCFMVSLLGDYSYTFPIPFKIEYSLKDLLDKHVDEKYYLTDKQLSNIIIWDNKFGYKKEDFLPIKEATKKGYSEAKDGDGVYITAIDKKRGTVQKNEAQTIKTSPDIGVVLRKVRTEEEKEMRKQGIEKFKEGHAFEPRTNGKSNTIDTLSKDNLVLEKK